jgi:divalent metal cation (Fe/Co/Zn/Cd) transporter
MQKLCLGRTRLEPIAVIILSIIMCAASVLVIYQSINTITNDAQYFTEKNTTKTLSEIDMSALPISVMVVTVVSKTILFFLCYHFKTPTMSALAEDHRNDVASNIVALICGLVGIALFYLKKNIYIY